MLHRFIKILITIMLILLAANVNASSQTEKRLFKLLATEEVASLSSAWLYDRDLKLVFDPEFLQAITPKYSIVKLRELKENIENNELSAEQMYPKKIITAGFSERISRTFGKPTVKLRIENNDSRYSGSVTAFFSEDSTKYLASLDKGDAVPIVCESWDISVGVALSGCQLIGEIWDSLFDWSAVKSTAKTNCTEKSKASAAIVLVANLSRYVNEEEINNVIRSEVERTDFKVTGRIRSGENSPMSRLFEKGSKEAKGKEWKEKRCKALDEI